MTADTPWVKATASDTGGTCVQMRRHRGAPEVRDSKNPDHDVLKLSVEATTAWLDGARRGEFDHLAGHP